ncbi:cell division control protein 25 [Amanita muscaria]
MYPSKLKINTSNIPDKSTLLSGIPVRNKRPSPPRVSANSNAPQSRIRSVSNASTTSSLSIVTPHSASTNASSSSVNLLAPNSARSPISSPKSPSLPSPPPRAEYVFAMHDYTPQNQNATCLPFRAGQVIHVLNKDPSGWWDGELEGRRGWFPSNYVNGEADYCLNDSSQTMRRQIRRNEVSPTNDVAQDFYQHTTSFGGGEKDVERDKDSYSPSLTVPLLSIVTVMQEAVRAQKVAHYLPFAREIVTHVRYILAAMGIRSKDAPILRQYPRLAEERRDLIACLNPMLRNAEKTLATPPGSEHDSAVLAMMHCAAEISNRTQRFLILGAHCGLQLPEPQFPDGSAILSTPSSKGCKDSPTDVLHSASGDIGRTPRQHGKKCYRPPTPCGARPTKSLADLRSASTKSAIPIISSVPPLPQRDALSKQKKLEKTCHKQQTSHSSTSSSSFSTHTHDDIPKPAPPPFPCGQATAGQILVVFNHTHSVFLSTNTAFIEQTHAYSRDMHASNKVRLCELGNEITDLTCKLLTLADSILQHPELSKEKLDYLRSSQQTLFKTVHSFTEIVQSIARVASPAVDEEQQKEMMLKSSTDSVKAAADCLSAAAMCLAHADRFQKPFVIKSVHAGDRLSGSADDTVQVQVAVAHSQASVAPASENGASLSETNGVRSTFRAGNVPCPITVPTFPVEPDFPSPASLVRTDDGTTWEGSTASLYADKIPEEKKLYGELPTAPIGFMPEFNVIPQAWLYSHDYGQDDVAYNSEGLLVGATLEALVEKMTPHDSIVDSAFSAVFFLTFRLFATPLELVETIIGRYNTSPPTNISQEDIALWEQRKGLPVRLRISNFIKIWVEFYWRQGVDDSAISLLSSFLHNDLSLSFPGAAQRILELLELRQHSPDSINSVNDRIRDPGMSINPPILSTINAEIPRPIMTKTLLVALRKKDWSSISVTDFDATELARQLTIMECDLYCAIQPEEILETGQQGNKPAVNVKAVSSLSTVITGWVAECILSESSDIKKRSLIIKFFIKIADRCTSLNNYSTPRAMLAALDSSTISRLHQTWLGVPQKHKTILDSLRRLADHGRNYHEYRSRLRNTAPPAVPFLGLYLTDVTFCREGNPSHRVSPTNSSKSLLNFNKYHKLARIVQDMQRFQVQYNFKAIPEVQEYLNSCFDNARSHGDLQDLYRRSLLVEPKQPADSQTLGEVRQLFSWATRSQSQVQTTIS